jgi:hypothetical protein
VPQPNQLPKLNFPGIDGGMQRWLDQLTDTVNTLSGYNGTVQLSNHLDMSGNRVMNIGSPESGTDALSSGQANKSYSASALRPQLESGGSNPMSSYRMLNNGSQREARSSFLNDLMSTPPSANTIFPTTTSVSGGLQVTIPSGPFTFADGSSMMLIGRTDVLTPPTDFTISSISVTNNLVTVQTTTATGLTAGSAMTINGVTPSQFNGSFPVLTVISPTEFTYQDLIGTGTGSGGTVELNDVYYYTVNKRDPTVHLLGPYNGDTAENRLQVCFDGSQIVAVVVLTASGTLAGSSGGGGSPIQGSPTAGVFF